eukprot:GEMP01079222.1.p1 GENE.GEMP01079222.1~~GEMP01079222.1.p1  ORF type:complete len:261 (-),score=80.03 GEMP01079222.1:224-1006(-)
MSRFRVTFENTARRVFSTVGSTHLSARRRGAIAGLLVGSAAYATGSSTNTKRDDVLVLAAIRLDVEKERAKQRYLDALQEDLGTLRVKLQDYHTMIERRRTHKVKKGVGRVFLNVCTFGASESVSALVDVTQIAMDVADVLGCLTGDEVALTGVLLGGLADVGAAANIFSTQNDGKTLVSVIDTGEEESVANVSKIKENVVNLQKSLFKKELEDAGVELLIALQNVITDLNYLGVVPHAFEKAKQELLHAEDSKMQVSQY